MKADVSTSFVCSLETQHLYKISHVHYLTEGTYIVGSNFYFMNSDGALCVFDVKTKELREILDNTTYVSTNI